MENIKKSFDPAQGEKEQTKIINLANPAPLGLLGFGMTTVLLNLHNADFFVLNSMVLAMGIFYGGFAQIIAGYEGIICGFSAIYTASAQILNGVYKKTVLPV